MSDEGVGEGTETDDCTPTDDRTPERKAYDEKNEARRKDIQAHAIQVYNTCPACDGYMLECGCIVRPANLPLDGGERRIICSEHHKVWVIRGLKEVTVRFTATEKG